MTINFYADFFCDGRSFFPASEAMRCRRSGANGFKAKIFVWDFRRGLGELPNEQHDDDSIMPCSRH